MISRGEAELLSQEILSLAERQRAAAVERDTRWLVRLHPVLRSVPALERRSVWRQAVAFGHSRPAVTVLRIASIALYALGYLLHNPSAPGAALGVSAGATAALIASLFVATVVVRRRVRELAAE